MMRIERSHTDQGRRLRIAGGEPGIPYQEKMMAAIGTLAPFRFLEDHGIEYAPPLEMEPLSAWIRRGPAAGELESFLDAFQETLFVLEGYLLDPEKVLWDPGWIFYDEGKGKVRLVYVPFDGEEGAESVDRKLCRFLWETASVKGWSGEHWTTIGRYSADVYQPQIVQKRALRLGSTWSPEKEKALNDLMGTETFLPPLVLYQDRKKPGIAAWLDKLFSFLFRKKRRY